MKIGFKFMVNTCFHLLPCWQGNRVWHLCNYSLLIWYSGSFKSEGRQRNFVHFQRCCKMLLSACLCKKTMLLCSINEFEKALDSLSGDHLLLQRMIVWCLIVKNIIDYTNALNKTSKIFIIYHHEFYYCQLLLGSCLYI